METELSIEEAHIISPFVIGAGVGQFDVVMPQGFTVAHGSLSPEGAIVLWCRYQNNSKKETHRIVVDGPNRPFMPDWKLLSVIQFEMQTQVPQSALITLNGDGPKNQIAITQITIIVLDAGIVEALPRSEADEAIN